MMTLIFTSDLALGSNGQNGRISGPTRHTEVFHLSKFAGFNQEN